MTLKLVKPDRQRVTRRPKLSKTSQMRQLAAHYEAQEKSRVKVNHFQLFKPLPGVVPDGSTIAMDFDDTIAGVLEFGYQNGLGEGLGFLGYSVLSELMQRPEYRRFAEIFAEEMTRKFIRVISASDEDQGMRIKLINDALDKFDLKGVFYRLAFIDCAYGRAQLYIDMGQISDQEKRSPLIISKETVPLHSLVGFKAIEPMWTYPVGFNSMDPTRDDFYKPRAWYAMGKEYHASRMIPFVGREVPDMLKPVYQFGGLSLTQMVKPYVDNWIRTRQNVGDAIEQFAQNVLKTNLESVLEGGGGEDLDARVALYNAVRSARGTMVIDKDTEDFMIASMPLGNLDKLQAQAQEQTASVAAIPLIKYLGITPSGLNASTDNEVRTFFDTIAGKQTLLYGPHMKFILDLIMQSELGEVNPDISYTFEALWQMSETERATMRSTNANTAKTYIDSGVVDAAEERKRLAGEEDGMYPGLDPDDLPEPPQQPGMDPFGGVGGPDDPDPDDQGGAPGDGEPGGKPPGGQPDKKPSVVAQDDWDDIADQIAADAEWQEHQHPRGGDGKFAKAAGGKKESLSAQIKKLVYAGHSNETIAEKLELPVSKKHYPGWYKADLAKKALKSYQEKIDAGHDHETALEHLHDHDQKSVLAKLGLKAGDAPKAKEEAKEEAKAEKAPYNFDAMNAFDKNKDSGMTPFDAFQELSDNHQKKLLSEAKEMVEKAKASGELESAMKWMPASYHAALESKNKSAEQQAAEAPSIEGVDPFLDSAQAYMTAKMLGYNHAEALSMIAPQQLAALKGMSPKEIEGWAGAAEKKEPKAEHSFLGEGLEPVDYGENEDGSVDHEAVIKDYEQLIDDGADPADALAEFNSASQKAIKDHIAKTEADVYDGFDKDGNFVGSETPAATSTSSVPTSLSGLTKVGSQLGSNPGGTYTDKDGNKFYVKHSKSDDHAKNEVLAGKLYELAGAPVLAPSLIDVGGGKLGTITPWATHEAKFNPDNSDHTSEVQQHFATHAWTGNWDAIGLGNDNQVKINGKLHTVDVGGALKYRAQGQAKKDSDFSDEVKDVDSLLDPSKNANAAKAFKSLTTTAKKESAQAVANIPDNAIMEAVESVYGANKDSIALTKKLIQRKESVAMQLGANTSDAPAAPKPAPVMPAAQQAPKTNLADTFKTELHPDKFASEVTKKFVTNLHKKVDTALKSSDPVKSLKEVKSKLLPKYGAAHKAMANVIKAAGSPAPTQAAAPTQEAAPISSASKVSTEAKAMKQNIVDSMYMVLPKNQPLVTAKLAEIDKALDHPNNILGELNKIQPIGGSSSVSKNKVGAYLQKVKEDHGGAPDSNIDKFDSTIYTPPKVAPPGGAPIPTMGKAAEIYQQVASAPPKKINDTFDVRHPNGQKVKAKLDIDTAAIPANWHAAVTAALEGDHSHGGKAAGYNVHNIMDKYYYQVIQKIATPQEQHSLSDYKGSGYTSINNALLNPPPSPSVKTKINHLKALIDKSPIPADLPVWRGMRCDLKGLVGHDVADPNELVGKGFVHKNFASVSRNESTSTGFASADWGDSPHVMMKFTLPAGAKGALTSGQADEAEIVLNAKSIFRIDKVEGNHGYKGKGHLLHVTYLGQQED